MRKQPKFEVGDILEEFYVDPETKENISHYWLVIKRKFYSYRRGNPNKWCKFYMYTFRSLNGEETWIGTHKVIDNSNEFRKVA